MEGLEKSVKRLSPEGRYSLANKDRMASKNFIDIASGVENRGIAIDLGSGGVVESNALVDLGYETVYAVDSSQDVFGHTRKKDSVVEIVSSAQKFIDRFTFKADFVSARHLFQYLPKNTHFDFIAKVSEKINHGGIFYFSLLSANSAIFKNIDEELLRIIRNSYTQDEIVKLMSQTKLLGDVSIDQKTSGANGLPDTDGNIQTMGSYYDITLQL